MSDKMTLDEFKKIIAPTSEKPDYKARFLNDLHLAGLPARQRRSSFTTRASGGWTSPTLT